MDDIERIQRINAMSQELKKFGFFEDTEQAIEGAKLVLMTDDQQTESTIFPNEDHLISDLNSSFERFKQSTNTRMEEMSHTIVNLHGQISDLLKTVSVLQQRNEFPQNSQPSPIPEQSQELRQESVQQECLQTQEPKTKISNEQSQTPQTQKPYYEKQGHYTSADVKIEDIFYYGNKR